MDELDIEDMEVIDILDDSDDDVIEVTDNIERGDEEKNNKQLNNQECLMCGSCHFDRTSNDEFSVKF